MALQTLKQITTLIIHCEDVVNMLVKFKVMRESYSEQLSGYNLFNASATRSATALGGELSSENSFTSNSVY